eukprot:TRINITY_DN35712_c0_g1_i1.p1 TRINITY_DN35712_c0_g1~~TRINITY_DN35712_c0_g1_i1.p1  ORF type:complete len:133 (+),score=32.30 TRINITY_DN35712_c0_g1_i1:174-572(+)
MSWQSYIDDQLMCLLPSKSTLTSAAIMGQDGSIWAQSANFPALSSTEIANIIAAFDDTSALAINGLMLAGEKYMVIQGEEGAVLRGKKGEGGCCIKKTVSALVFGIYDKPTAPGECNVVVENLGDYLTQQGI